MKAVTLRNLPPEIQRVVQKLARQKGSINQAVISLLEERVGVRKRPKVPRLFHDLDELAGSWKKKEAADFEKSLSLQRKIDREVWNS